MGSESGDVPDGVSSRPTSRAEATPVYLYAARVEDVVDGDTYDVRIDLGFETYTIERMRAMEIDTREVSFVPTDSEEYQRGMQHMEYVQEWVSDAREADETGWPFVAYTDSYERGAYGRLVGDLHAPAADEWLSLSLLREFDDVSVYQ